MVDYYFQGTVKRHTAETLEGLERQGIGDLFIDATVIVGDKIESVKVEAPPAYFINDSIVGSNYEVDGIFELPEENTPSSGGQYRAKTIYDDHPTLNRR